MQQRITLATIYRDLIARLREISGRLDEIQHAQAEQDLSDDDLEFHRRVREAWKDVDEGKVVTRTKEEFFAFLDKLKHEKSEQHSARR